MSWFDRIENNDFSIRTGDGKVYTPLWKSGETKKDFNVGVFDFISKPGSLIDRREVKARSFPLVFWFQGEDNIEQADAFDVSANDKRAWLIKHPFYGDITGQPLSISRNDQNYNVTEVSVDFWETITDNLPKKSVSVKDQLLSDGRQITKLAGDNYAAKTDLKPVDLVITQAAVRKINLNISSILTSDTYTDYQAHKIATFAAVDKLLTEPSNAISAIGDLTQVPAEFSISVTSRLALLKALYADARSVLGIKSKVNNKAYFEAAGAAIISAMAISISTPADGDYLIRKSAEAALADLASIYADYVKTLDDSYVPLTVPVSAFSPSHDTALALHGIVVDAVAGIADLLSSAKVERSVILGKDTNLIVLTHKYMGLDEADQNIETFRQLNGIKNKNLFLLKKGRVIKYLV